MPKIYEFIKVIKTLMTEEHLWKISAYSLASIYHFLSNVSLIPWQIQLCFQTKSTTLMHLQFCCEFSSSLLTCRWKAQRSTTAWAVINVMHWFLFFFLLFIFGALYLKQGYRGNISRKHQCLYTHKEHYQHIHFAIWVYYKHFVIKLQAEQ